MATQNLFEKYGIKEVADVTFYRIERKNETYESQREITVASILKGAIETKTVYPLDANGAGEEEGFEAYVFTDADVLIGSNYECDDVELTTKATITGLTELEANDITTVANLIAMDGVVYENEDVKVNAITNTEDTVEKTEVPVEGSDSTWTITATVKWSGTGVEHTHEYTYEEQILMLFAKKQNLIKKTGVRYKFTEKDIFGTLEFNDNFAESPNSTEKVVVLGVNGQFDANAYLLDEVTKAIQELAAKTYKAKAYDVIYKDYAELVVDDEMGYFNPNQVGLTYADGVISTKYSEGGTDTVILGATMWKEYPECLSINDAIEALRAKKATVDQGEAGAISTLNKVSGGYSVSADNINLNGDDLDAGNTYSLTGTTVTPTYALASVLEALATVAGETEVTFTPNGIASNRAIYVNVENVDTAASAYIYLLKNVNYKKLALDTAGIFSFTDRMGKTAYYKDAIFAGVEYLALVVIGTKGLIFKVDRHGVAKTEQIAWMINENGYITDKQAEKIVANGIIHTIDIDKNDETFEATCTVSNLKVRKIQKTVNRYVPVLFLDTLKVSTIEQTAEQTAATGGKGNAQLIVWDYGKEITLTLEDALYSPASMSAMLGSYEGNDFTKGVKETKKIDRTEKCIAKRSFIVPAGNSKGVPSEGENTAQAVYIDPNTMQPYQDGTPIAEGEMFLKWTRSVAYGDNSLGHTIEISADKFPGTYKVVGDTFARNKTTGEDQRFQFVVPQAKMTSEQTITLEAEGDPTVFNLNLTVLRPDDGIMVKLIQYDVVENEEENDGSTMVKGTENLNLLDDAEMFKVSSVVDEDNTYIGATEY